MLWLGVALAIVVVRVPMLMLEGLPTAPVLERLLGFPAGQDEVPLVASDRTQQHELLEARLLVDRPGTGGKTLLEFRTGTLGDLDGIDLHDGHGADRGTRAGGGASARDARSTRLGVMSGDQLGG